MKRHFNGTKVMLFLLFIFALLVPLGFIIMALWNNILVPLLHISVINFWQALGLFLLSRILFGGFPGRWGAARYYGRDKWWGKEMRRKWENMTEEERTQFKEQLRSRCRNWGYPAEQEPDKTVAETNQ